MLSNIYCNPRNWMRSIIRDKMAQLKKLRNNYDYKEIDVTYDDSKRATDYADDIIKAIKKYI